MIWSNHGEWNDITFIWCIYIQLHFDVKETEEKTKECENNTNNEDMNEDLNLSDSGLQQKLILMKWNWYQMKDLNTLTINECL